MRVLLIIGVVFGVFISGAGLAEMPKNEARIGVLAYRGSDELQRAWLPLREYLAEAVPDWSFSLVPMTLSSAAEQIKSGQLDFVVTNPGHFVALDQIHRMSVLASRSQRKSDGRFSTEFGSTLITYKDSGIQTLQDVAGTSVVAIDADAFGGFQVAWYELERAGVDLFSDSASLTFVGFPMDQVLTRVLSKQAQVGIVRSGLIEELVREGRVDPDGFEILNTNVVYTHPDAVSTNLYPEWPFAALATTDPDLKVQVTLALLQSAESAQARKHGLEDVWAAPLPYHSVRELTQAYDARVNRPEPSGAGYYAIGLVAALMAALAGTVLLRRGAASSLPELATQDEGEDGCEKPSLTDREQEVLLLIAKGRSTKEIAIDLGISPKTVEYHRANLLRKYGARTSSQLVAMAY